jgi:hypothetical protein
MSKGSDITYKDLKGKIDIQGEILEWDPPSKLSYVFNTPEYEKPREKPSYVIFN